MHVDLTSWGWPQWLYLGLFIVGTLIHMAKEMRQRQEPYLAVVGTVTYALVQCFFAYVLHVGGFW